MVEFEAVDDASDELEVFGDFDEFSLRIDRFFGRRGLERVV